MAFLNENQLNEMGFGSIGKNVLISEKASFYNPSKIFIGNNVRIDDYCILSTSEKGIYIGSYIHISCFASLIGAEKITIGDFTCISGRVSIYSSNDDYTGIGMTGPMVPIEYRKVQNEPITIGRHVIIGAGSVVLPGVKVADGVAVGALSLINKSLDPFFIYVGCPAKFIKKRKDNLLLFEKKLNKQTIP